MSRDPSAPEVWASAQAIHDIETTRFERLLNFVKRSAFFTDLFEPCHRDREFWVGNWRLMVDPQGVEIEAQARDLFGTPSMPYSEMNLFTMLIRFKPSSPTSRSVLLRLIIEREPSRKFPIERFALRIS